MIMNPQEFVEIFIVVLSAIVAIVALIACVYTGIQAVKRHSVGLGWLCFALLLVAGAARPSLTEWRTGESKPVIAFSMGNSEEKKTEVIVEDVNDSNAMESKENQERNK